MEVLEKGLGYGDWITGFRDLIEAAGVNELTVLNKIRPILLDGKYSEIDHKLSNIVREFTGLQNSDDEILIAIERGKIELNRLIEKVKDIRHKTS